MSAYLKLEINVNGEMPYVVWTANHTCVLFNDETLPDFIKWRVAMINMNNAQQDYINNVYTNVGRHENFFQMIKNSLKSVEEKRQSKFINSWARNTGWHPDTDPNTTFHPEELEEIGWRLPFAELGEHLACYTIVLTDEEYTRL